MPTTRAGLIECLKKLGELYSSPQPGLIMKYRWHPDNGPEQKRVSMNGVPIEEEYKPSRLTGDPCSYSHGRPEPRRFGPWVEVTRKEDAAYCGLSPKNSTIKLFAVVLFKRDVRGGVIHWHQETRSDIFGKPGVVLPSSVGEVYTSVWVKYSP